MHKNSTTGSSDILANLKRTASYIRSHCNEELPLEKLAAIAHFSKFHFHRLFHEHFGETVHHYHSRIRLEQAANRLVGDFDASVADIAKSCGFSNSQNFATAFKKHFKCSPTSFRNYPARGITGNAENQNIHADEETPLVVEVKTLPLIPVVYIPGGHLPSSNVTTQTFYQLFSRSIAGGLVDASIAAIMGVGWTDTDNEAVSKSTGHETWQIPDYVRSDHDVCIRRVAGGKYAVSHCETREENLPVIKKRILNEWMPSSDYLPDTRPDFLVYYNNPHMNPRQLAIVDLCLSVRAR